MHPTDYYKLYRSDYASFQNNLMLLLNLYFDIIIICFIYFAFVIKYIISILFAFLL